MKTKRNGTQTSSFGVTARVNHDSSRFYNSKLYEEIVPQKITMENENPVPPRYLNKIFCKSSENMEELPDNSVHLMVTSPPYNVGKDYDENLSLEEYLDLLRNVFSETYRVLVSGGRACINIANIGRKPYIPLHSYIIEIMAELNFLMRGEIIWDKSSSAGSSTAWGSWQSASNPTLRDVHEYIMVFSKDSFSRTRKDKEDTISKQEFLEFTKSIWDFPTVSAKKIGHPAPFPEELPRRLMHLYTFKGEIVLDPFIGSGQTGIAAIKSSRYFIGYDTNKTYCELATKRVNEIMFQEKI